MENYCQQRPAQLNSIHGYIFKSKSPSCGLRDVPLFDSRNISPAQTQGVFAAAILALYPDLPVCDELQLTGLKQLENFLQQTRDYQHSTQHV